MPRMVCVTTLQCLEHAEHIPFTCGFLSVPCFFVHSMKTSMFSSRPSSRNEDVVFNAQVPFALLLESKCSQQLHCFGSCLADAGTDLSKHSFLVSNSVVLSFP